MQNLPAIDQQAISIYLKQADILQQTIKQIEKDIQLTGILINAGDKSEEIYLKLISVIEPFIAKLIQGNYQKLLQILYRIDIAEKQVAEVINNSSKNEMAREISHLIIKRALQKVILRNHYKA